MSTLRRRPEALLQQRGIRAKQRPCASIITEALVQKVLFGETTATGVKVITGGGAHTTEAKKEVILSCGALNTPKILELSGIGNKEILDRYRISVVVDNSNVGENLQDQLMTETMEEATKLYYEHNASPLTIGGVQSTAFMPCLDENGARYEKHIKDLMDRFLSDTDDREPAIRGILEQPDSPTWAQFMFICQANLHETGYSLSRDSVHISSANVEDKPAVDTRYFLHPLDLDIMAYNLLDVEKLHKYLRDTATTTYRPCGTAAMLAREQGGVVDEKLRVHGTTNLRVCEASILPLITVGNIMSTVYAVAERAAEIIKADA
ncbi:glucose dehydrogenase [Aspergillus flavus]|nr:glucose dehydrogenase [Aspergillus flavus]